MGKFKKMVAAFLAGSMLFALAGCGKKIKAYDEDGYYDILENKLDIDEDSISSLDGIGYRGSKMIEGTLIQTMYEECTIFIAIYDDEDDAEETFDEMFDMAEDFEDNEDLFEVFKKFDGELAYNKDDNTGYIIVSTNGGTNLRFFGDINMSREDFYGAVYYSENVIVRIMPYGNYENGDSEHIVEIIEALGYPTLEDVKD
ncbi:MAG: hypothetical protein MJ093_08360 [Saccharofermentans sp.]|nr:hypothetical protein [Saccharofermentans sp.]